MVSHAILVTYGFAKKKKKSKQAPGYFHHIQLKVKPNVSVNKCIIKESVIFNAYYNQDLLSIAVYMLLQCCPCLTSIHFFVCSVKWEDYSKACRYTQSSFWRDICAKLFNSKQKGHSSNLFCSRLHDMVRWYSSVCTTHKYTWCQRLPNETLCLFCCQNKTTFFLRVKQKADEKQTVSCMNKKEEKASINLPCL